LNMPDLPFTELGFLFDDNPNPMWVYDVATSQILKVNKAAVNSYGYTESELLSLTVRDLLETSAAHEFASYIDENKKGGSKIHRISHPAVWKYKTKAGSTIHAEVTSRDVKYRNIACRIVVAADVSDKLHYQEEARLREMELLGTKSSLEALINNTEDQIWSVDMETRYVYMNQSYRSKVAYLTGAAPNEGDYSYLHPGYSEPSVKRWVGYYRRALAGEIYNIVDESIDPDTKEVLSFEVSFNPIYKANGEITGAGCFARNITQRLKTEKAMINQNERLRHIASLTSHELRRPVASMLGLIAIMDRANFFNPDNREIIEHLLTVGNEIDEVIRLIVDKTFTDHDHLPVKYQSP